MEQTCSAFVDMPARIHVSGIPCPPMFARKADERIRAIEMHKEIRTTPLLLPEYCFHINTCFRQC